MMVPSSAKFPATAIEHMSQTAKQNLPAHLQTQAADPGVYLPNGLFGAGPGWYHFGSSEDQLFLGHPNEADYFVFDFDVTSTGGATSQGFDVATHYDRGLDGIVALDSFAVVNEGESYGVMAAGADSYGKLDYRIDYTLVRLRFEGPTSVETEIVNIGAFGIIELF